MTSDQQSELCAYWAGIAGGDVAAWLASTALMLAVCALLSWSMARGIIRDNRREAVIIWSLLALLIVPAVASAAAAWYFATHGYNVC